MPTCRIASGAEEAAGKSLDNAYDAVHGADGGSGSGTPTLDVWFLELIAADVVWLTDCKLLWQRHRTRFEVALNDGAAAQMIEGIETTTFGLAFGQKHATILRYVEKLATLPQTVHKGDFNALRAAGADETEIVEACLAVAVAVCRVRLVRGLGIELDRASES